MIRSFITVSSSLAREVIILRFDFFDGQSKVLDLSLDQFSLVGSLSHGQLFLGNIILDDTRCRFKGVDLLIQLVPFVN